MDKGVPPPAWSLRRRTQNQTVISSRCRAWMRPFPITLKSAIRQSAYCHTSPECVSSHSPRTHPRVFRYWSKVKCVIVHSVSLLSSLHSVIVLLISIWETFKPDRVVSHYDHREKWVSRVHQQLLFTGENTIKKLSNYGGGFAWNIFLVMMCFHASAQEYVSAECSDRSIDVATSKTVEVHRMGRSTIKNERDWELYEHIVADSSVDLMRWCGHLEASGFHKTVLVVAQFISKPSTQSLCDDPSKHSERRWDSNFFRLDTGRSTHQIRLIFAEATATHFDRVWARETVQKTVAMFSISQIWT